MENVAALLWPLVFSMLLTGALGAPSSKYKATLLSQVLFRGADGSWISNYRLSDGTDVRTAGHVGPNGVVRVTGSLEYVSPEGAHLLIHYTADERGYLVHGGHQPRESARRARADST